MFKLLNPGNTNGDALVGVLAALLPIDSNQTAVTKCSLRHRTTNIRQQVNCIPRTLSISNALAKCRGLLLLTGLCNMPHHRHLDQVRSILSCMKLTSITRQLIGACSNNVVHHLRVTRTALRHPPILFLSRPAINLSPITHGTV